MRRMGRIFKRPNSSSWWIAYCHRGKEIRESGGSDDCKVAERLLKRRLKEIGADSLGLKAFVGPQQDRLTVGDLLDALESDFRLRELKSLRQTLGHLRIVRAALGDLRAVDVSAETVNRYIQKRLSEKRAPATINRETTMLGESFRLAIRRRQISSMPEIPKLRENNVRSGFFEKGEFGAIVGHLPEYLQGFARFGFLCGWRKGEIRSLAWADVDLPGRVIRLRSEHSKNGQGRALALEGELWSIIERQSKMREYKNADGTVGFSPYVFHLDDQPIGDFRKAWATAEKKTGFGHKLFHDLRRTAARNLIRAGVPERVAMAITGHKTRAIFDRYNIVSEDDLRQAVQKAEAYLSTAPKEEKVMAISEKKQKATK